MGGSIYLFRSNYSAKDDMQDQTFNLLYKWLLVSTQAMFEKDAEALLNSVWAIYSLVHPRMKPDEAAGFAADLEKVEKALYTRDKISHEEATAAYESMREVYLNMTRFLYKQGISLTARVDPNTMITQRSDL